MQIEAFEKLWKNRTHITSMQDGLQNIKYNHVCSDDNFNTDMACGIIMGYMDSN